MFIYHERIINIPIHVLAILLTSEPIIKIICYSLVITSSIHL